MSKNLNDQFEDSALNAREISEDNDEIVDLLQVVKPGKNAESQPSETQDVDFSADLEAMLNTLSEAEKRAAAEPEAVVPFPDPTPVEHEVDHDESLDLPSMDEIDKLLEDLGGEDVGDLSQTAELEDAPLVSPSKGPTIDEIDELDALPAEETSLPAAAQKKVAIDDDFLLSLTKDPEKPISLKSHVENAKTRQDQAKAPPRPEKADASIMADTAAHPPTDPATEDDLLGLVDFGEAAVIDDALLEGADLPESPEEAEPGPVKNEKDSVSEKAKAMRDEVDLNELDALVDNVLASAPGPAPAPVLEVALLDQEFAKLRADINRVTDEMREAVSGMRKGMENDTISALARATSAESGLEALKTHFNEQVSAIARQTVMVDENSKLIQGQSKNLEEIRAEIDKTAAGMKKNEESVNSVSDRINIAEKTLTEQSGLIKNIDKNYGQKIQTLEENYAALSSLPDRMEGVEQSMAEQVNRLKQAESGLAACESLMRENTANTTDYAKSLQEAVQNLSVLTDRVKDLEGRFTALESQMEKTAAAAAAKVIREEITALLKGGS